MRNFYRSVPVEFTSFDWTCTKCHTRLAVINAPRFGGISIDAPAVECLGNGEHKLAALVPKGDPTMIFLSDDVADSAPWSESSPTGILGAIDKIMAKIGKVPKKPEAPQPPEATKTAG